SAALASPHAAPQEVPWATVDKNGTVHVPDSQIPYSDLATSAAKTGFIEYFFKEHRNSQPADGSTPNQDHSRRTSARSNISPETIKDMRKALQRELTPKINLLQENFHTTITAGSIGGVQTDVVVPQAGISATNTNRVLINLPAAGRYHGQVESIPVASVGHIK